MSYSRIRTTQRSLPANLTPSPPQISGRPSIQNSSTRMTSTVTQRRSAIPTSLQLRSRRTNVAGLAPSSPTEDTVRGRDQAGQALTTFRNVGGAGGVTVPSGLFMNLSSNGPVNIHNGVPSRHPLGTNDNIHLATHDYSSNSTPRPSQNAEYDIYYNELLVKGRGTPLWEPGPQMMFPTEYRRNGVSIGDVGILYRTGDFAFLFNIFLPADHEINEGRVPNGFIPLDKSKVEKSIKRSVVYDRCLASSSLKQTSSDFAFQTTGTEGAILVMPDGAVSEDLRRYKLVEKYIADNAKSWYEYVESDDCGMQTENGDIRVVVGMDKASSWGTATFENVNVEDPLQFEFKEDGRSSQGPTYKWDRIITGRAGPSEEEIRDLSQEPNTTSPLRNQCVFVRTLNVSIAGKVRDELAVYEVRTSCFKDSFSESSLHQRPPVQRSPDLQTSQIGQPVSHPSNLLNKYLLEMCPNAKIVITKDSDWISVITENDATTPSFEDICARVLASHIICEKEGVVTLKKRKHAFNNGSMFDASAIITPAHQQTSSEDASLMHNDKEAYVIGRLFLETPDDRPVAGSPGTLNNDLLEKHLDDTLDQMATESCLHSRAFDKVNASSGDDDGNDVCFTQQPPPIVSREGTCLIDAEVLSTHLRSEFHDPAWEPARSTPTNHVDLNRPERSTSIVISLTTSLPGWPVLNDDYGLGDYIANSCFDSPFCSWEPDQQTNNLHLGDTNSDVPLWVRRLNLWLEQPRTKSARNQTEQLTTTLSSPLHQPMFAPFQQTQAPETKLPHSSTVSTGQEQVLTIRGTLPIDITSGINPTPPRNSIATTPHGPRLFTNAQCPEPHPSLSYTYESVYDPYVNMLSIPRGQEPLKIDHYVYSPMIYNAQALSRELVQEDFEGMLMDHSDNWSSRAVSTLIFPDTDVCWSLYVGRELATSIPDDSPNYVETFMAYQRMLVVDCLHPLRPTSLEIKDLLQGSVAPRPPSLPRQLGQKVKIKLLGPWHELSGFPILSRQPIPLPPPTPPAPRPAKQSATIHTLMTAPHQSDSNPSSVVMAGNGSDAKTSSTLDSHPTMASYHK